MKVKTTGTKEFKPIELVITIESEKELMALINMCGYNESIPDLVGKDNRNFITLFLDETRDALTERM
jgi:hypothetical protein